VPRPNARTIQFLLGVGDELWQTPPTPDLLTLPGANGAIVVRFFRIGLALGFCCICFLVHAISDGDRQSTAADIPKVAPIATSSSAPMPSISPLTPLAEALDLYRKGDFDAAIEKYQQILHGNPKSPDAYAGLIRTYLKKKDVQQAFDTATEAVKTNDSVPVRVA
jgi:tetratricopeptide (TPR) repeat protein